MLSHSTHKLQFLRSNFSVSTWLLMGASLQCLLVVLLPAHSILTLSIAVLLLSARFGYKSLIAFGVLRNPVMDDVILKKTTARLPDKDGNLSADGGGGEKIAVLLLGFKSNHPFGIFAPGFKEIGDYFVRMSNELSEGAEDNGCTLFSFPLFQRIAYPAQNSIFSTNNPLLPLPLPP